MTRQAPDLHFSGIRPNGLKLLAGCAGGMAVLGLQACATMPKAQYPIYMQDKPAETAPPASASASSSAQPNVVTTAPAPQGNVAVSDLPPPPAATSSSSYVDDRPAAPSRKPTPAKETNREPRAGYAYVLVAHDTLYGISRRFNVPFKKIEELNGLGPDSNLHIGAKILLPPTAKDNGADPHANGEGLIKLAPPPVAKTPASKPAPVAPQPVATTPKTVAQVDKPVADKPFADKPVVSKPGVAPASQAASSSVSAEAPPSNGFPSNARLAEMGKGLFVWPVRGKLLVPFGQLAPNVRNDGINIGASAGTEVKAASDGVVVYEGDQVKELGNTIYIKHDNGWYTGYSHLNTMLVKNNERVSKGEVIGTVGQTGVIDKPQLHFEVRYTPSTDIAKPVDPTLVLPK